MVMEPKPKPTAPAPELLLAQVVQGSILFGLLLYATYEESYSVPLYSYSINDIGPYFKWEGRGRLPIGQFRTSYSVLALLAVAAAYALANVMLYTVVKLSEEGMKLYNTPLILVQESCFCTLMLVCSVAATSNPGPRAVQNRETEILIAAGISMFCCVSSGVGVYYAYRVYKGL